MLTALQYRILKALKPSISEAQTRDGYEGRSKIQVLLGKEFLSTLAGKTVVDFGCGHGDDTLELARSGARKVIGIDIREEVLAVGRRKAQEAGLANLCTFTTVTEELADVVISLDAFEHFDDPASILKIMGSLLAPRGEVFLSFGPTWFHPLGGHLFSPFPWAHLLFREEALIRWRSTFRSDGATRFHEVAGGLNQMTIRRCEELIASSPFELVSLELVPIRKVRALHNRWTREFTTAIVRCHLRKPN